MAQLDHSLLTLLHDSCVGRLPRPQPAPLDRPWQIIEGDCTEAIRLVEDGSVDAVVTDPPYAEIKRDYGYWSEADWHRMMRRFLLEVRPKLAPKGSMCLLVQPTSKHVGEMRLWISDFVSYAVREYGYHWVQDLYAWNYSALPMVGAMRRHGLCRPSVKHLIWLAPSRACYRDQDAILWQPSETGKNLKRVQRAVIHTRPSGLRINEATFAKAREERGGVTPYNLFPVAFHGGGGHPGATPQALASRLIAYMCPPGGTVLDPWAGSANIGLAALKASPPRRYIGIERLPKWCAVARERLAAARARAAPTG